MTTELIHALVLFAAGVVMTLLGFFLNTHTRKLFLLDMVTFGSMIIGIVVSSVGLWHIVQAAA